MDQELKSTVLEAFNYAIAAVKGQLSRAKVPAVTEALKAEVLRFENAKAAFSSVATLKK